MSALIVVDDPGDWQSRWETATVVSARDYLSSETHTQARRQRVFNLCRSYRYQKSGYYVSLLAEARGHTALPSVMTMEDFKSKRHVRFVNEDLDQLMQVSFRDLESGEFTLSIYFGQNLARRHARLALALFNMIPAPLLRARFLRREGRWRLIAIQPIALGDVPESHREFLITAGQEYLKRRSGGRRLDRQARFELAILHNPREKDPPSNAASLKRFVRAARSLGMDADLVTSDHFGELAEYDALFIRETTAVNHHTYHFSRQAERNGLVVIDDPTSILRCTNKVYLAELMRRLRIPTPATMIVHRGNAHKVESVLGLPCVLKQPDSAFSRGVKKANTSAELQSLLTALLSESDLVIAQQFQPTDFDWRIGVLEGKPLYACRYFMAKNHWQIVRTDAAGRRHQGNAETLAVENVPEKVLNVAIRAARAVGNGLYGVDLKQSGSNVSLIEVNDNPSIDRGIEDELLGNALYLRIMGCFLSRLEQRAQGRP